MQQYENQHSDAANMDQKGFNTLTLFRQRSVAWQLRQKALPKERVSGGLRQ